MLGYLSKDIAFSSVKSKLFFENDQVLIDKAKFNAWNAECVTIL